MKFFVLDSPAIGSSSEMDVLFSDRDRVGEADQCPECGSFVSMLPALPPIMVELILHGSKFPDVAKASGGELLISEKVHRVFCENNILGLDRCNSAEIVIARKRNKTDENHPAYYLAGVCLGKGVVDPCASELDCEPPKCTVCWTSKLIRRTRSIVLKEGSWGREDVFRPRGLPGVILISENLKSELDKCSAVINVTRAEEYAFDFYPNKKG